MASVHLKNGKGEAILAKALWHQGVRYRKNYKNLPGSPDVAITKYKIAIFVDGEFWHGYKWSERKKKLRKNREYWIQKIEENMARDIKNDKLLKEKNWKVIHFWEKDILNNTEYCVELVKLYIKSQKAK